MQGFRTPCSLPLPLLLFARSAKFLKLFSLICFALTSARLCICPWDSRSLSLGTYIFIGVSCAESDVRVRVRGRIVRVNVQRRQVRVVGVVAAPKTAHKRKCSCLISTLPATGTPISVCCWSLARICRGTQHLSLDWGAAEPRGFVVATLLCFRFPLCDSKCRKRCTSPRARAHCSR